MLSRPKVNIRMGLQNQLLQLLRSRARNVKPSRLPQLTKDPDDNKFLECADAARADYLVTANARHFPQFWKKTKVISPREFIDIVGRHLLP